jgi:hypothetical protein
VTGRRGRAQMYQLYVAPSHVVRYTMLWIAATAATNRRLCPKKGLPKGARMDLIGEIARPSGVRYY